MSKKNYLNLDEIESPETFVFTHKGKEHQLAEVSVQDFVDNAKAMQELSLKPSVSEEVELLLRILTKAFPTCPEAEFRAMEMSKLNALMEFANMKGGQSAAAKELEIAKKAVASNPPEAGQPQP